MKTLLDIFDFMEKLDLIILLCDLLGFALGASLFYKGIDALIETCKQRNKLVKEGKGTGSLWWWWLLSIGMIIGGLVLMGFALFSD